MNEPTVTELVHNLLKSAAIRDEAYNVLNGIRGMLMDEHGVCNGSENPAQIEQALRHVLAKLEGEHGPALDRLKETLFQQGMNRPIGVASAADCANTLIYSLIDTISRNNAALDPLRGLLRRAPDAELIRSGGKHELQQLFDLLEGRAVRITELDKMAFELNAKVVLLEGQEDDLTRTANDFYRKGVEAMREKAEGIVRSFLGPTVIDLSVEQLADEAYNLTKGEQP